MGLACETTTELPFLFTQNLSPKDIAWSDIMKLKVSQRHMQSLDRKGLKAQWKSQNISNCTFANTVSSLIFISEFNVLPVLASYPSSWIVNQLNTTWSNTPDQLCTRARAYVVPLFWPQTGPLNRMLRRSVQRSSTQLIALAGLAYKSAQFAHCTFLYYYYWVYQSVLLLSCWLYKWSLQQMNCAKLAESSVKCWSMPSSSYSTLFEATNTNHDCS